MTIIDQDAVLILGAGTSAPFFFPLGGDLIGKIGRQLSLELSEIEKADLITPNRRNRFYLDIATTAVGFDRCPILATVASRYLLEDGHHFRGNELNEDIDKLKKLATLLRDQTSETIDDFIVENPDIADVAKVAVATQLFTCSYDFDNNRLCYFARPFQQRHVWNTEERNWVHLFINIVRQGIRAGVVSLHNRVQIITFNYDGVLERILEQQFSNTGAEYEHWSTYIRILHVHGHCGDIGDVDAQPANTCAQWARRISVVNEPNAPQDLIDVRQIAINVILHSRKIYAVGFAFSRPNVELLQISRLDPHNLKVSYCNWDGNAGLRNSVNRLKAELDEQPSRLVPGSARPVRVEEASGAKDAEVSVSDWFKAGYAGDLPG